MENVMNYYSLPFAPNPYAGNPFQKVGTDVSVRQHIRLLLNTMPGCYRFSPFYGSILNKHHFLLPDKRKGDKKLEQELKFKLQQNLRLLIGKYEPRLIIEDIEVTVNVTREDERQPLKGGGRITFKIHIIGAINGRDPFDHSEAFFLK